MRTFRSPHEVLAAAGDDLGRSDWMVVDQDRIDAFAEATGDHQWIHVDPDRAAAGPFGGTIAHGYLTLSLVPALGAQVFAFGWDGPRINYGANKVRFPAPVRVGSRVRSHVVLVSAEQTRSGLQIVLRHTIEIEDEDRPGCVAETVVLCP